MDWPRQSKINSCTLIAAKVRMSPAMSSGSPENDSPASFNGHFYRYSDIRCEPFPVQKPHPPIWVGGHSPAALRRTPDVATAGTRSVPSPPRRYRRQRCARI
jgi:alkanesulfonate monooxygenase SsuD/methylene tetrahydromethanopterin reductase-like flavin-dependent oxidoreductase (luciferase family)